MKRLISLLLAMVLTLQTLPLAVLASETTAPEETSAETVFTEPVQTEEPVETTVPAVETTVSEETTEPAPTEETAAVEETEAPTEPVTEPAVSTEPAEDPTEEPTVPAESETEEATESSEAETEPSQETAEPTEETVAETEPEEVFPDSSAAPEGYLPFNQDEELTGELLLDSHEGDAAEKRVLLIQDAQPWDSNANVTVLKSLGYSYDLVSTRNFLSIDLTKYGVVIFANDQAFSAYNNYKAFREYLEIFADLGGVIVFGACDNGWANGNMTEQLPGAVSKFNDNHYRNRIADPTHPIVTGELTQPGKLTDDDLYEYWCSHTAFKKDSLPVGSKIILENSDGDPTLVEYPVGHGRVIASGLTWEFNYYHGGQSHPAGGKRGYFARDAMDDMFAYAVRVSAIGIEDLTPLENYYNNHNQHTICVAQKSNQVPIPGAQVTIDGEVYTADENGVVKIPDLDGVRKLVTVSASGFRTQKLSYVISKSKTRLFHLEEAKDNKPYFTMMQEQSNGYDLMTEACYYEKGNSKSANISVSVEWNGHGAGKVDLLVIDKTKATVKKTWTNANMTYSLNPGKLFDPGDEIYMVARSADGTVSDPQKVQINIFRKVEKASEFKADFESNQFQVVKPGSGTLTDGDYASVFPANYKVQADLVPVQVEKSTDEAAGTITYYLFIGAAIFDSEGERQTLKQQNEGLLKDAEKYEAVLQEALDQINNDKKLFASAKITDSWDPEFTVAGYYKCVFDLSGKKISDGGGIAFKMDTGEKTIFGRQFLAGPVPLYLKLTGSVGFDEFLGLDYKYEDGICFDGKIEITPAMKLSGGLGVNGIATVGVNGKGELKIQIQPSAALSVVLSANLEAYLFFVFDWEFPLAQKTFPIFPRGMNGSYAMSSGTSGLKVMDMSFVSNTSQWNPMSMYRAGGLQMLQNSVLPSVAPAVEGLENGMLVVFQSAVQEDAVGNSLRLNYAAYRNGSWSNPVQLSVGDYSAMAADLATINGETWAIWQQSTQRIDVQDTQELMAALQKNTEVYCARYDVQSNTFDDPVRLTNNDLFESHLTFAEGSSKPVAVWAETDGTDKVRFLSAEYSDGQWSAAKELGTTNLTVLQLRAVMVNGQVAVSYTAKAADGEALPEVYLLRSGVSRSVTSDSYIQENVQLLGQNLLFDTEEGLVVRSIASGDSKVMDRVTGMAENFKVTGNGETPVMYWTDGSAVYASRYLNGIWSAQTMLFECTDYTIKNVEAVCTSNRWTLLMTTEDGDGVTALQMAEGVFETRADLKVYNVDESRRTGSRQPISFTVENTGAVNLAGLTCALQQNGTTISQVTLSDAVEIGQSVTLEHSFEVPELTQFTTFQLVLMSAEGAVLDMEQIQMGRTDLVMEVKKKDLGEKILLEILISNDSNVPSDAAFTIQDGLEDGLVMYIEHMSQIKKDESYLFVYSFDKDKIAYNEDGIKYYELTLKSDAEDLNHSNNHYILLMVKEDEIKTEDIVVPDDVPTEELVPVSGIQAAEASITLTVGEKKKLEVSVLPSNATNQTVLFETSDPAVAFVEEDGLVIAYSEGTATVTAVSADGGYKATITVRVVGEEQPEPEPEPEYSSTMTRVSGSGRCQTAIEAAKELKKLQGGNRFNAIIVADGDNYPDALSGSYLAAVAKAPILLVQKENAGAQTSVLNYIKYNLNLAKGTVYILGGKSSVSEEFENSIAAYAGNNVKVVRLAGSGRYATSLKIIQEADKLQGKKSNKILVCDGGGYADSLSASATGLPVLLVNGKETSLTAAQENYLKSVPNANIFVIGGKNSVSDEIRLALNKLDADGNAKRLSGSGREQTSVAVAKEFFPNPTFVVLADGNNYPDGLSGGPLAYAKNAPLLLIREGREAAAKSYIADRAKEGFILGGKNSVSDTSVQNIFGNNCLIK